MKHRVEIKESYMHDAVGVCMDGCGLVRILDLVPSESYEIDLGLGICPKCSGEVCVCPSCLGDYLKDKNEDELYVLEARAWHTARVRDAVAFVRWMMTTLP